MVKNGNYDSLIGIGGGSVMDTAKAVSVMATNNGSAADLAGINTVKKAGICKILVPTTAGTGSDLSSALVMMDEDAHQKVVSYSEYHFADISLIDPVLTLNLPPKITAESGIDAFSHALESYVAIRANPLSEMFAIKGIEYVSHHLRPAFTKGHRRLEARYFMCLGVCMGTMGLRSSGSGALHAVSYPVAAEASLSHGESLAIMMPHVMQYNLISNLPKFANIAKAMGEEIKGLSSYDAALLAVEAVRSLIRDVGLPERLRDVGINKSRFNDFAEAVKKNSSYLLDNNPRDFSIDDLKDLYSQAY
jgi:alcohol dehydrogenase